MGVFQYLPQDGDDPVSQFCLQLRQFGQENEAAQTHGRPSPHLYRRVGKKHIQQDMHKCRAFVLPQAVYGVGPHFLISILQAQAEDAVEVNGEIDLSDFH